MSMTKRQLLAGLAGVSGAALLPGLASGQELTFGPTVLREDFDVLRRAWTTMHPGLYRYNTERDIARLFSRAAGWANRERSLAEAFVQLAAMSAALRCGHTFPNPANQGRRVREALLDQRRCVPFAFRWIDREMIVTAALPGVDLRAGDRILRLDGVRAAELRRRLMPLMRADGGNDAKRLRLMSVDPKDDHGTFDLFRGLAFGAAEMCRVELERDGARLAVEAATV
ncbi:MAG: hypothetical protein K2X34_02410, partial [Hyphomonadaceae bacterium]|nr:hypothetical protein [Hyphomonadaceae bacterium]